MGDWRRLGTKWGIGAIKGKISEKELGDKREI
jgi:hypothetical protein